MNLGNKLDTIGGFIATAVTDFFEANGVQWAAAISYYTLLSAFPLLLAAVSIAAYFVQPQWVIDQITNLIGQYLPQGAGQIESIVRGAFDARGSVSIFSLLLLLWSGSRVFGVLIRALNKAFEESHSYSYMKRLLVELVMMITLGLLFILAIVSRYAIQFLWTQLNILPGGPEGILTLLQGLIPSLLLFLVFYLIYRYVPRREVDSQAALIGALFTTVVIMVARPLFIYYITQFSNYNLIYGSLAVLVILLIWVWIVSIIVLLGGQVTSEIQLRYIDHDKPKPGQRR